MPRIWYFLPNFAALTITLHIMQDYIQELNEEQRAAVLYNDGPSLVIAGAGSGKTRVLTYKIAYLLEHDYKPWNILALTFTNKAAREMKERIAALVGEAKARRLWMGTFHSVFLRILHAEAERLGFGPRFTVYDTADTKSLLRTILKEMQLDEKTYKPGVVQARISSAKNHLVTPAAYAASSAVLADDRAMHMPSLHEVYRRYWERCRQADAMDFDDLLLYTFLLFRDHPDVLARYREQFGYVLVDEYQDTNIAQHNIVLQLAAHHGRVCVVGDDAQSIYSFRGADIDNILSFTKAYPGTRVFKLERNYRSTQTIVRAANSLIEKNQRQIHKEVFSEKEKGEAIGVLRAYSDVEEAEIIVKQIAGLRARTHCRYADFAILYRTNAQSRIFEETLRKRGLPYRIYGGLSFYQRKEVKDVIAYFRLVVNPNDEEAFKRIVNYPKRGIGDTTVARLVTTAAERQTSVWDAARHPADNGLSAATAKKVEAFCNLVAGLMETAATQDAYETGLQVVRTSGILQDICQDTSPENLARKENIEELLNGMSDFCATRREEGDERVTLADFLSEVSLLTDQDTDTGDDADDDRLTLMTVHSAKGLEFRNVFVVGMEEGLFPSNMAGDSPRAMEEERRLFYVAITRAEEHCYLSYAKTRYRYGKMEFGAPSRFLQDIDARYLDLPAGALGPAGNVRTATPYRPTEQPLPPSVRRRDGSTPAAPRLQRIGTSATTQAPATPSGPAAGLHEGQHIEHERFGLGEVVAIEGMGENAKATIRFQNAGQKVLLLRFARFKVVD